MSVVQPLGAALVLLTAVSVNGGPLQPAAAAGPKEPTSSRAMPATPAQPAATATPAAPTRPAPAAKPAAETKVVTSPAIHALVLPMKGSYLQHQEAFARLSGYLARKGVAPSTDPFGRYFNDASQGEEKLSWEVGVAVPEGFSAEAPFEIKDIPAGLTAVRVHRGSYEELETAWPAFVQWATANGYQVAGPPLQLFQDFLSPQIELRLPVRKIQ